MTFLREVFAAAVAAAFFAPAFAAEPAASRFEALARLSALDISAVQGESLELDVDLAASSGFSVAVEDYYRFKFLPLQSVLVDRCQYAHGDKIGSVQQVQVSWRYDYFLAFENLYDFYPRPVDGDDAGFSADLPADLAGHLGLRARVHLIDPVISESTTFWKVTHGKPVDFTLKKRYLVGVLDEIDFVDTMSGAVLCRIRPGANRCSAGPGRR